MDISLTSQPPGYLNQNKKGSYTSMNVKEENKHLKR